MEGPRRRWCGARDLVSPQVEKSGERRLVNEEKTNYASHGFVNSQSSLQMRQDFLPFSTSICGRAVVPFLGSNRVSRA